MEQMMLKVSAVKAKMTALANQGFIIYLTGRSGAGKDYVAAKVMSNSSKWCFLDKYGRQEGDKWTVKVPEDVVKKSVVFTGVSDNMDEVMEQILTRSEGKLAVFYVIPSPDIFRATQAAKAKDATNVPASWLASWLAKSKLSNGAVHKEMMYKMNFILNKIVAAYNKMYPDLKDEDEANSSLRWFIVDNSVKEGEIIKGWHGSQKGVTADANQEKEVTNGKA